MWYLAVMFSCHEPWRQTFSRASGIKPHRKQREESLTDRVVSGELERGIAGNPPISLFSLADYSHPSTCSLSFATLTTTLKGCTPPFDYKEDGSIERAILRSILVREG